MENTNIEIGNGHQWATVTTNDSAHGVSVSIGSLLYDDEGRAYLLAFQGETELRLYVA